jgi:hypothetical protein
MANVAGYVAQQADRRHPDVSGRHGDRVSLGPARVCSTW